MKYTSVSRAETCKFAKKFSFFVLKKKSVKYDFYVYKRTDRRYFTRNNVIFDIVKLS